MRHVHHHLVHARAAAAVPIEIVGADQPIHRREEVDTELLGRPLVRAVQFQPCDLQQAEGLRVLDALRVLVQHLLDRLGLADAGAASQREAGGSIFDRVASRDRQ